MRWRQFPPMPVARRTRRMRLPPKRPRLSVEPVKTDQMRSLQRRCRNRPARARLDQAPPAQVPVLGAALPPHDDGGANGDAVVEIGYVFVGHAEATGRYRLANRVWFVGAVNAIKRRAQIHGA